MKVNETSAHSKLPPVGVPVGQLLRDFGEPLLSFLAREPKAEPAHLRLREAQQALQAGWEARRMSERLASHAESLAELAEETVDARIRQLFDVLAAFPLLQAAAFPHGLSAAVTPRAEAQVIEARRIGEGVSSLREAQGQVAGALAAVSSSALALSSRLAALDAQENRLVEAVTRELAAERSYRRQVRQVIGTLSGLFVDSPSLAAAAFESFPSERTRHAALPPAPPATPPASSSSSRDPAGNPP